MLISSPLIINSTPNNFSCSYNKFQDDILYISGLPVMLQNLPVNSLFYNTCTIDTSLMIIFYQMLTNRNLTQLFSNSIFGIFKIVSISIFALLPLLAWLKFESRCLFLIAVCTVKKDFENKIGLSTVDNFWKCIEYKLPTKVFKQMINTVVCHNKSMKSKRHFNQDVCISLSTWSILKC